MPDNRNAKDCLELPPTNFFIFTLKNMTWRTYLISFTVLQYCSISFCLYRACFTHLISSNLSCNLCLWYYDQLVHFDKENANVYRQSLWKYSKRFHCLFEWHVTPHMTLSMKPVLGRHPIFSRQYSIPWGCPLNTGFHCNFINFTLQSLVNNDTFENSFINSILIATRIIYSVPI